MAKARGHGWWRRGAVGLMASMIFVAGPAWSEGEDADAGEGEGDWELPVVITGQIEFGGRSTFGDDDESQFRKYRDLDSGVIGGFRILVEDKEGRYYLRGEAENPGYDDQRYELETGRYGRYKVDLFYKELPHFLSGDAVSLYTRKKGNEFLLPGGVQSGIAGAADQSAALATALMGAGSVDLRFRQIEGGGGVEVRPIEGLTLFSRYQIQDRQGSRALGMDWGSPGGNFVVFAGPVDDTTHELTAGGEYAVGPVNFGLDYRGSFYDNEYKGVTADNPLVATDADGASSRGRSSLDPDNAAHTINLSASTTLPTSFPARITGSFAYGVRLQDDEFLPHTINSALASPTLPTSRLDGKVHTVLANVVATARPTDKLNLKARFRYYDYDNDTDRITFDTGVVNDGSVGATPHSTVPNDFTTYNADLDGAYEISDDLTGTLGYGFEKWRRSKDRQVRDLYEHGPTAKLDWKIDPKTRMQASYGFNWRDGDSYDTYSYVDRLLDADGSQNPAGEIDSLRKFDQADAHVHKADALIFVNPSDTVELTFSGGLQYTNYRNSHFGVQSDSQWFVGFDAYWQACQRLGIGTYYSYEKTRWNMKSRWRPRDFAAPPTVIDIDENNWRSTNRTRTHTAGINFDVAALPDRLDLRFGYEINHAWEKTDTESPSGTQGIGFFAGGDTAYDYPSVRDVLQAVNAEAILTVTENVELRTRYRYEDFLIRDYRTDDLGPFRGGTDIFLADTIDDYQAHVMTFTAVVSF